MKRSTPMIETDDDPLHAGALAERLQIPRGRREELGGRSLLGRRAGSRVDHGLHPGQRRRQPLAGHDVDALGAGDPDDVVSPLLEHVDDMAADSPGRARDCDLSTCRHHPAPCLRVAFSMTTNENCSRGHVVRTTGWRRPPSAHRSRPPGGHAVRGRHDDGEHREQHGGGPGADLETGSERVVRCGEQRRADVSRELCRRLAAPIVRGRGGPPGRPDPAREDDHDADAPI